MLFETASTFRVRYAETDQMGVVYHANYLVWCEIGRTDFIRNAGRSYADLERDGVRLAVVDVQMRCHASARYDDPIVVYTTLASVASRGMTFTYRIMRQDSGERLVVASTSLVSLSPEGRPAALPPDVRSWLTARIQPDGSALQGESTARGKA
jgi:acyl-CoA thioester hydrolase